MNTPSLPAYPDDPEARITALLLGELPAEDAAAMRQEIAADPELTRLHDQLAATLSLLREAVPVAGTAAVPAPQFSPARREALRRRFQTRPEAPIRSMPVWRSWLVPLSLAASLALVLTLFEYSSETGSLPMLGRKLSKSAAPSEDNSFQLTWFRREQPAAMAGGPDPNADFRELPSPSAPPSPPPPLLAAPITDNGIVAGDAAANVSSDGRRLSEVDGLAVAGGSAVPPSSANTPALADQLERSVKVQRDQKDSPYGGRSAGAGGFGGGVDQRARPLDRYQRGEPPQGGPIYEPSLARRYGLSPRDPDTSSGRQRTRENTVDESRFQSLPRGFTAPATATPPAASEPAGAAKAELELTEGLKTEESARGTQLLRKPVTLGLAVPDVNRADPYVGQQTEHKAVAQVLAGVELQDLAPAKPASTVAPSTSPTEFGSQFFKEADKLAEVTEALVKRKAKAGGEVETWNESGAVAATARNLSASPTLGYGNSAAGVPGATANSSQVKNFDDGFVTNTPGALPGQRAALSFGEPETLQLSKPTPELKSRSLADSNGRELSSLRAKLDVAKADKVVEEKLQQPPGADEPVPRAAPLPPVFQPEVTTADNAFSTFSLNVADVSFKLAATSLERGQMPDASTIRSEEFLNAMRYRDPEAAPGVPVAFAWDRAQDPFGHNRDLLRFAIRTGARGREASRPLQLVLLLDSSGSMERADRANIVREALRGLASQLQARDRVSVVAFARTARLWVDALPGDRAGELVERVGTLTPEGGTNLGEALRLAYETARQHFDPQGVNRVVLLTDGAANLGDLDPASLQRTVESWRQRGIALDCFGVGWEGFDDEMLETLARHGDGRYGFINRPDDAATEFAAQLAGALQVAAADVKVQVEFNPQRVKHWRQIGYAKHQLTKQQFRDNTVDAAELAATESGNALYSVEVDPNGNGAIGTVRVRFREPATGQFREHAWPLPYQGPALALNRAPGRMRLAVVAAQFAEWLAGSPYAVEATPSRLIPLIQDLPAAFDPDTRPQQLESMLRQAQSLSPK